MTTVDEIAFEALVAEWRHLETYLAEAQRRRWIANFAELTRLEDELRRGGLWTRGSADIFGVLGIGALEVIHCRALGWLVDPLAPHGLGSTVLERFLADLHARRAWDAVPESAERATVVLEEARDNTRADVVIRGPDWTVIIEAKVYAGEQPRQCQRLETLWSDEVGAAFVFLTIGGCKCTTAKIVDSWFTYRWAQFADHLQAALEDAPPPESAAQEGGRLVAKAYLGSMRQHLGA